MSKYALNIYLLVFLPIGLPLYHIFTLTCDARHMLYVFTWDIVLVLVCWIIAYALMDTAIDSEVRDELKDD